MENRVSVVILNWNGRDDTLACLASVAGIHHADFQTIVVDNGSADGSVAAIRAAFPRVEIIETGRNLGFAGGNNVGIRRALDRGADHVLLLNNDTEVDPGLLEAFADAARRFPAAGVFSAKIYFHADPRRIWYAGASWNPATARFDQIGEGLTDDCVGVTSPCETAYACGCAFYVSSARLREIGLLDEDFFLYFEETDWCSRAKAAGYPSMLVPDAKVWHKVSVSFGGEGSPLALYFITRNRQLWARRHGSWRQRLAVQRSILRALWQRFVVPIRFDPATAHSALRVWWWDTAEAFRDASNLAFLLGVRDYWLRRFGDCPDTVRVLARQWSATRAARAPGNVALVQD